MVAWIKASFKVFPYEQERRRRQLALLDQEERKAKQRITQWRRRILICVAVGGFSLWWVIEQSPDDSPQIYFMCAVIVLLFSLAGLFIVYRQSKRLFSTLFLPLFRKSGGGEEKTHVVTWSQPISVHSPRPDKICNDLPHFCKNLIAQAKPS